MKQVKFSYMFFDLLDQSIDFRQETKVRYPEYLYRLQEFILLEIDKDYPISSYYLFG